MATSKEQTEALHVAWDTWQNDASSSEHIGLKIIASDHRMRFFTLLAFIHEIAQRTSGETLTVLLPEIVGASWKRLFSHPTIVELKASLFFQPHIVVTNVSSQQQTGPRHIPLHPKEILHRFIVPIADLDRAATQSLAYARSISPHVVAVHVALDQQDAEAICSRWHQFQEHFSKEERMQLVVIESPYRSLVRPLLAYIDTIQDMHPEETLTVLLPELVVAHWWEQPLHNQTALCLKAALLARPGMVVTDIPQHLHPRG